MFRDCRDVCVRLASALGTFSVPSRLVPTDFAELRKKLATGRSVATSTGDIIRIKILFNWAVETKLLTSLPDYANWPCLSLASGLSKRTAPGRVKGLIFSTFAAFCGGFA